MSLPFVSCFISPPSIPSQKTCLLTSFAPSSREQMIVSRTITGVGNGINAATIPMWVSEIVKPHNRGRLNSFSGSMIGFGIFFSYWFDYGLSYVKGDISWRLPIALQMLFAMVTLTMVCYYSLESP
jgi:MFS family permease